MLVPILLTLALATATGPPALTEPGVLLTFDDTYASEWAAALPLLAEYDAHATFFVTRFDQLTETQVADLRKIRDAGHAIGCHGLRHIRATEHAAAHGVEDYVAKEIAPALEHMHAAGFDPMCFAYPMSDNNAATDAALLKIFRHLRTGAFPVDGQRYAAMDALFTPVDEIAGRGCLPGKGVDRHGDSGKEDLLAQIFEAMDRAKEKREVLTLYAHNIAETGRLHLKPATLEKILGKGRALGLRFYSFDALP